MTWEIGLTLALIAATLLAFIKEWAAPDVIALTVLCLVVALGLVGADEITVVFRNEAPLTIAALFIIGGALERSGAVEHIGDLLKSRLSGNVRWAMLSFTVLTAFFSAWMNNTAIVAILLPVTIGFARSKDIPASKLLMPLSYASILGGCCTLIGTSTNLLVNGALRDLGEPGMGMFTLAPIGIPLAVAGIGYLVIFGPRLIPARASISGSLDIEYRTTPLYHLLIPADSALIGRPLRDTLLWDADGSVQVLELRRDGRRMMQALNRITLRENDRVLVSFHSRKKGSLAPEAFIREIGARVLSTVDGIVTELVVRDESSLVGVTMARSDFRQRYNAVVLAVHRNGRNITQELAGLALDEGDTLLVVTPLHNLEELARSRDFILTDRPDPVTVAARDGDAEDAPPPPRHHAGLAWTTLIGVVAVVTLSDFLHDLVAWVPDIPIHFSAMVGALALLWLKVISPREAYASIDWQVLLMLYGLLSLGLAMQKTGTAEFLADGLVHGAAQLFGPAQLPSATLWAIFLLTLLLTEILSNNATAVMMIPIVIRLAHGLEVNPMPFVIAVTVAASTAFALPMGYQTHLMVFGPGGYKFSDFLRVGIPLNLICWGVACLLIPLIWPF